MSGRERVRAAPGRSRRFEAALLAAWLVLFVYVVIETRSYPNAARLFPQAVAYVGVLLSVLALWRVIRPPSPAASRGGLQFSGDLPSDYEDDGEGAHPLPYLLWTIGYFTLIAIFGFFPATVAFVAAFLRTRPGVTWTSAMLWTGGVLLMAYGMGLLLQLRWPGGLVMRWLASG